MSVVPTHIEQAVLSEERRHMAAISALIGRWPAYRSHLAYALLGSAIAVCDSFGIDVDAFLLELRRREPKPSVLVPPTGSQS